MFFSSASQPSPSRKAGAKGTWARGVVACPKCGTGNTVQRFETIIDEFSVRCSRCGHRSFHRKAEIGVHQMPERRQKKR